MHVLPRIYKIPHTNKDIEAVAAELLSYDDKGSMTNKAEKTNLTAIAAGLNINIMDPEPDSNRMEWCRTVEEVNYYFANPNRTEQCRRLMLAKAIAAFHMGLPALSGPDGLTLEEKILNGEKSISTIKSAISRIAMGILLPQKKVVSYFNRRFKDTGSEEKALEETSKKFCVSERTLLFRLIDLGVVLW